MIFFKRKTEFQEKTPLKSDEYLELFKMVERLRISFEGLQLDLELYKHKLKASKGLKEKEEEEKDNFNKVLLPER